MNSCEIREGRLLEIRVDPGYQTMEDVNGMYRDLMKVLGKHSKVVIVADWRRCKLITEKALHGVGSILKDFNSQIERSGIIASSSSPKEVRQFLELVRQSGHKERQVFTDSAALHAWLGQRLTEKEQARLREFLG